jgi:nucleoid DNA-binding protein
MGKSMTKKDIVMKIAIDTNVKQIDVKKVVQMTFDIIVDALARGERPHGPQPQDRRASSCSA